MAMACSHFQTEWAKLADKLGLTVRLSVEILLAERTLVAPVLLEGYGARNGMILLTDFDAIGGVAEELANAGYGYSVLGDDFEGGGDMQEIQEMLEDWGGNR